MSLENGNYINDLNPTNPSALDAKAEGDDHIRLIKKVLKNTFPGLTKPFGANQDKSANYSVTATDNFTLIEASAAITLTLPTIASLGTPFRLGIVGAGGAVTVVATSPNKINNSSEIIVPSGQYIELVAASANFYFASGIPSGVIASWSGAIANIPQGWRLCDGTNGTPNLRDKFIVGAGSAYTVSATGGSANAEVVAHTHTATVTDSGHSHVQQNNAPDVDTGTLETGQQTSGSQYGGGTVSSTASTASATTGISVSIGSTGNSGVNKNLPPYYALAFIQKV